MDVAQALRLRKNDRRFDSVGRQEVSSSQPQTRFNKKNNIKEILIRNFFRKYPIPIEVSDMEQIKIEKEAAYMFDEFVITTKEINSKSLAAFEAEVSNRLKLRRQTTSNSQVNQHLENYASPNDVRKYGPLLKGNSIREAVIGMASQGNLEAKINRRKEPNSFALPKLGSMGRQMNLKEGKVSLKYNQRRSQILQEAGNIVGQATIESGAGRVKAKTQKGITLQRSSANFDGKRAVIENSYRDRNYSVSPNEGYPFASETAQNPYCQSVTNRVVDDASSIINNKNSVKQQMSEKKLQALIKPRNVTVDDLPSDISLDEWGEIQRYGQIIHEDNVRKQKQMHVSKITEVKNVLDQQVKDRLAIRDKQIKEKQDFDQKILEQAKFELQIEAQKAKEKEEKMLKNKEMRDKMLKEAKFKKENEQEKDLQEQKGIARKLIEQIEQEKQSKVIKKKEEREAAQRVIRENQEDKKKRLLEEERRKEKENKDIEEMNQVQLEKERKRERDIAARGARIQAMMDKMADVVDNKDKELQKKQEKEYIQQCIEQDEAARLNDLNKKMNKRSEHQKIKDVLDAQVNAKRQQKVELDRANKSYMQKWTKQADEENANRQQIEHKRQEKIKETQNFQIEQMFANPNTVKNASEIKIRRKFELGGQMNPEEARMNRGLLKEIAKAKKEGVSQRIGSATASQII